jgi:xanthine dehydrogenase accessory factor
MQELAAMLEACADAAENSLGAALATVVMQEGSAYRRAGARMVVLQDGRRIGTISGGCLEADVSARAVNAIATGIREIALYDSTTNGDLVVELGCKGAVGILIEPLISGGNGRSAAMAALEIRNRWNTARSSGAIAVVLDAPPGSALEMGDRVCLEANASDCALLSNSGILGPTVPESASFLLEMRACIALGRPALRELSVDGGTVRALIEPVFPPIAMTIAGEGGDVVPLAEAALRLGWEVTVCSRRSQILAETIGHQCQVIRAVDPVTPEILPSTDARTALVIMNHNLELDLQWLRAGLAANLGYVGVLGPRKRAEEMLSQVLLDLPEPLSASKQDRLFCPIGLNIGAETPEEIAISIVSEISAVMKGRSAGFLRDHDGPIHPHTDTAVIRALIQNRADAACALAR